MLALGHLTTPWSFSPAPPTPLSSVLHPTVFGEMPCCAIQVYAGTDLYQGGVTLTSSLGDKVLESDCEGSTEESL